MAIGTLTRQPVTGWTSVVTGATLTAQATGAGALSATAAAEIPSTASSAGHGALTVHSAVKVPGTLRGRGATTATAKATKFTFTRHVGGQGSLVALAEAQTPSSHTYDRYAGLRGGGALTATATAKFTRAAALRGAAALSAAVGAGVAVGATGRGALSATAKATKFTLPCAVAGQGSLSGLAEAQTPGSNLYNRYSQPHGRGVLSATVTPHVAAPLRGVGVLFGLVTVLP